ncbi:hypothetical protein SeMB42_g00397 [Synchytrium endobioticum]|uniref:Uncharacterized protein n=1 Tax=Synchytrium endobioticum TaxID=286115 RepID=A0A507DTB2_9FUNG|nr:hypothetical protein SeMB42_g00397 [Synchytrium endobioticum]
MKNPSKSRQLDEVFLLPLKMLAKSRYVLDNCQRRYVRTPSFKINGLVLSIDTTSKPPPVDRKVEDGINLPNIFSNKRFVRSHDIAHTYYSTTKYKRKVWHADKAKRGELDRVLTKSWSIIASMCKEIRR